MNSYVARRYSLSDADVVRAITDGVRLAVGINGATWDWQAPRQQANLLGMARWLSLWLARHRHVMHTMTAAQLAHGIHAAYTAFSINEAGLTREECRAWGDEPDWQRDAYLAGAGALLKLLNAPEGAVQA